jgi:hypothetical protein
MADKERLSDEDMQRVERVLRSGYNDTPRKPFRPLLLMVVLTAVVAALSSLSLWIARLNGVY